MFKRPTYLKPRLVRVRGHGGEPLWGILVSRRVHTRAGVVVDVVTVGHSTLSARKQTISASLIVPANILVCPVQILDNLVTLGVLSKSERRSWAAEMRALWRGVSLKRNITRLETTVPNEPRCPANARKKEVVGHAEFFR